MCVFPLDLSVSDWCSSASGVMLLVLFSLAIFSPWPAPLQNTNQDTAKPQRGLSKDGKRKNLCTFTSAPMLNLLMITIKQSDSGKPLHGHIIFNILTFFNRVNI